MSLVVVVGVVVVVVVVVDVDVDVVVVSVHNVNRCNAGKPNYYPSCKNLETWAHAIPRPQPIHTWTKPGS